MKAASAASTMILVNPQARQGEVGRKWPELEHQVLGALEDGSARVEFTTSVDYGAGAVRKALKEGVERILVVGGDGTVSEAIQGFFEGGQVISPSATLMVMPAGRGDDFFKSMIGRRCISSADAWKQGLELLKNGKASPMDLGRLGWIPQREGGSAAGVHDRAWVNVASFGYPAWVVKRVHERPGKNAWAYLAQAATSLFEYKPVPVRVQVDGETAFEGPLFCGFVLNGSYNGGGIRWSDEARIDDGWFHVVVAEPRDALSTVLSGPSLWSGRWRGAKGLHVFKGKRVEVRSLDPKPRAFQLFEVDGELPERPGTQGAVFEVLAGAVRVWR